MLHIPTNPAHYQDNRNWHNDGVNAVYIDFDNNILTTEQAHDLADALTHIAGAYSAEISLTEVTPRQIPLTPQHDTIIDADDLTTDIENTLTDRGYQRYEDYDINTQD